MSFGIEAIAARNSPIGIRMQLGGTAHANGYEHK